MGACSGSHTIIFGVSGDKIFHCQPHNVVDPFLNVQYRTTFAGLRAAAADDAVAITFQVTTTGSKV